MNERFSSTTVREHQLAMLDLLKEFDRICQAKKIKYLIFAGTMLGAVRHKGFIPWDDDLDIIMLREEYDRFITEADSMLDKEKFFLQKEYSKHWPMFFSKLRLNGTACIERYCPKNFETHMGVYIDIFPCDNLYNSKILRKMQFLCSKIIIAKGLDKRGYETNQIKKKLFMLICKFIPRKPVWNFIKNQKNKDSTEVHSFLACGKNYNKNVYPREWLEQSIEINFENNFYPISQYYDAFLALLYGDYMKIPSEEERRCKVHAEIVDLKQSYQSYAEIQKTVFFNEYSKSIR